MFHTSLLAVAQVDEMSGGRIELGLGAGWYEEEHAAYAIPFPPVAERFGRRAAAVGREVLDLSDLDHLALIADQVLPEVA